MSQLWSKDSQNLTATDLRSYLGHIWALIFDPLIYIFSDFLECMQYYICIPFLNHISDLINLSSFWLESNNLKIWPLYKRSMTFGFYYIDLYLQSDWTYESHVIKFFAPYDPHMPQEEFACTIWNWNQLTGAWESVGEPRISMPYSFKIKRTTMYNNNGSPDLVYISLWFSRLILYSHVHFKWNHFDYFTKLVNWWMFPP